MTDPDGVIAFHRDTVWIGAVIAIPLIVFALLLPAIRGMVGISWHILTVTGFRRHDDPLLVIVTGVLSMMDAMMLGLTASGIRAWRTRNEPMITIGPSGISDHRKPPRTIAWSDVADARIEWGGRYAPTRLWLARNGPTGGGGRKPESVLPLPALRENPRDLLMTIKAYPAYEGRREL